MLSPVDASAIEVEHHVKLAVYEVAKRDLVGAVGECDLTVRCLREAPGRERGRERVRQGLCQVHFYAL